MVMEPLLQPALIGLFYGFKKLADLGRLLALADFYIRLAKLGNDLIHHATFMRY